MLTHGRRPAAILPPHAVLVVYCCSSDCRAGPDGRRDRCVVSPADQAHRAGDDRLYRVPVDRRYCDKFTGKADWEPIYELKRQVSVPVIGNGDIFSVSDALTKIGNLDGVMIGRGTFGNPWLMREVSDALRRERMNNEPLGSA